MFQRGILTDKFANASRFPLRHVVRVGDSWPSLYGIDIPARGVGAPEVRAWLSEAHRVARIDTSPLGRIEIGIEWTGPISPWLSSEEGAPLVVRAATSSGRILLDATRGRIVEVARDLQIAFGGESLRRYARREETRLVE